MRVLYECPDPRCFLRFTVPDAATAERYHVFHKCPRRGPTVTTGKSLIHKAWEQLDAEVDELMRLGGQPTTTDVLDQIIEKKARARGKAEILALFMTPHFATADQIADEAGRRYGLRAAGKHVDTPGVG